MIEVQLSTESGVKHILSATAPIKVTELQYHIAEQTGCRSEDFYIVCNGRLVYEEDICQNGHVTIVPRLVGGKGGFGSMLRAIGAQIEKTTNREACRDLSGRRLRDINEEKRLKVWIEKQAKRDEEAAERKKKKLERLCAEPRHEFKDKTYERERSILTERVGDAVEEGFKLAVVSGEKRKHEEVAKPAKKKTLLDLDIDSDELDSSDGSEDEEIHKKKVKTSEDQTTNDSGHSSDATEKNHENSEQNSDESSRDSAMVKTDRELSSATEKKSLSEVTKETSSNAD